jgi:elongator complex protein 3
MREKEKAISYLVKRIISGENDIASLKKETCKRFHLAEMPKNTEIFAAIPKGKRTKNIQLILKRKPVRTISGVTPIALMIQPQGSCRHRCIYCPFTGKAPKSYTGEEPAALRARENLFDPVDQIRSRFKQFMLGGHPTEKCEIIVMGGTFLEMNSSYKHAFVKSIYDTLNGRKSRTLEAAKRDNETARHRAIGLTIETRPDVCGKKEIDEMLEYGATRVELGVQNPNDRIYQRINRGHTVKDVENATILLKDSAYKICYHIMPGLPGSSPKKDIEIVKKLFEDDRFKPDMLKIYPTLVMPGTGLHKLMLEGEYAPYSSEKAAEIIAEFYRYIPKYVRVMRIQRDIPANLISEGVKKSNLRELVETRLRERRIIPNEIRCREIGFSKEQEKNSELTRIEYSASKGKEIFLSFENEKHIFGFIRLRAPHEPFRKELEDSALIREFHVYGEEAGISKPGRVQHTGLGASLLAEAERIAKKEWGYDNLAIISGVGVREYFYKKRYTLKGPYVVKKI